MLEGGDASGDRWATAMNAELSTTVNGGGFGRSSRELYTAGANMSFVDEPGASFDEDDWGVLAAMGNTPTKRGGGGAFSGGGGGGRGGGGSERGTPGSNSNSSASGPLSSGHGGHAFTFDDIEGAATMGGGGSGRYGNSSSSSSSSSSSGASVGSGGSGRPNRAIRHNSASLEGGPAVFNTMTPRASALMELNADFKAGRISKEEKALRKQQILYGSADA